MTSEGINLNLQQKAKLLALEVRRQNSERELRRRERYTRNVEALFCGLGVVGLAGLVALCVVLAGSLLK